MGGSKPHARDGGTVHLLEMALPNVQLIRYLVATTNSSDLISVHHAAVSNEIGTAFGLGPDVVSNLRTARLVMSPGDEVCLMSDGLYRLISPYATHTLESLMADLSDKGLPALIRRLRDFEESPDGDIPRIKRRDDASAVHLKIEA